MTDNDSSTNSISLEKPKYKDDLPKEKNTKKYYFLWIIIVDIIWGLIFLPSLGVCMMSPMMFDAPGSADSPFAMPLLYSVLAFPVSIIVAIIGSLISYSLKKLKLAVLFTLLPVLDFIVAVGLMGMFFRR